MYNRKKYMKKYRKLHKKRIQETKRNYNSKHKDKVKLWNKKCYEKNREQRLLDMRNRYEQNKDKMRDYNKIYREKNKDRKIEWDRLYRLTHKEEIKESQTIYMKNRRNVDINFRLLCNLRTRIYNSIKNNYKSAKSANLLGCTVEHLKQHLEKQFKPGMNWDNYGLWHVDHIIPCASFDLSKTEEQVRCFNWKNLQPLWANDNIMKSDKIINFGRI